MRILAADYETGGTTPGEHAHVSLGIALMEDGNVLDSMEWIFAPPKDWKGNDRRKYEVRALEVSGIGWKQILVGTPVETVVKQLQFWVTTNQVKDLPVVAFNASFDLAMYSDMLFLAGSWDRNQQCFVHVHPPLVGPWICSKMLAQDILGCADYKLDTVAAKVGKARTGTKHSAIEDAILAGEIYFALEEMKVAA